jgi:hypothetical protein
MQIVNSQCHVCRLRIASERNGAYCPNCLIFFHRDCAPTAGVCPKCRQDFDALALDQRSDEESRTTRLINRGRYLTLLCAAVIAGEAMLSLVLGALRWGAIRGQPFPVVELVVLPVSLLIALGLYLGIGWFRKYIILALVLEIPAFVVFVANGLTLGYPTIVIALMAFRASVHAATLGLLTLSRSVSFYFGYWSH